METRAMIMAAGVGSRLEPLTSATAKPMAPICNVPAIGHILRLLHQHGIREVAANLHHRGDLIRAYVGDGSPFGLAVRYHDEQALLGTAGGVKWFEAFLDRTFLVVSGDACTDADLTALLRFHKERGALATIALKEVDDTSKFGVVVTDETGRIQAFQEKPKPEEAKSRWVNTGIYVFEPAIFAYIPPSTVYDFGHQVFPALVDAKAPFYGFRLDDYWCDIGALDQYRQAHYDSLAEEVRLAMPGVRTAWGWLGEGAFVHPEAVIEGKALVGAGARIEAGARLTGRNSLGNGTVVGPRAQVHDAVIWQDVRIGEGASLDSCIVADGCTIGTGARIDRGAVLSRACIIDADAQVGPGVRVWPEKRAPQGVPITADLR